MDSIKAKSVYYIGMKICDHYTVHIIDEGYETKEFVSEDNIEGFIQCLEHFGFVGK